MRGIQEEFISKRKQSAVGSEGEVRETVEGRPEGL